MQQSLAEKSLSVSGEALNVSAVKARVKSALPLFADKGAENEAARTLVPEVFAEIESLGLHKLLVPVELGGVGASIVDAMEIVEMLAGADASTGWVVFAAGVSTSTASGYLNDDAAREIFKPGARALVAGAGAPTGTATKVDGGYRLTGNWSYGSGLLHAEWSHSGAFVHENGKIKLDGNGAPVHLMLHVPIEQVEFHGNWDVLGLRATGSVDYSITDAFVPESYAYSPVDPVVHRRPDVFGSGMIPIVMFGHSAWAAGVARRMLNELADYVSSKGMRAGSLAASDSFSERYGEAEARVLSARAFLYDVWGTIERKLASLEPLATRDITLIRLALSNVTYAAAEVSEFAYRIAGGEPLRQGTMQRIYRDIHSGSQHITSAASVMQACGRELAGLAPGESWQLSTLTKSS